MSPGRVTTARVLASRSRLVILRLLRTSGSALDIADIAAEAGLHANTTREHLQQLVDAGFVVADPEHREGRGRPRMRYQAVERPAASNFDDRLRSRMIDLLLASYESGQPAPPRSLDAAAGSQSQPSLKDSQLAHLELHFEDLGFDPEVEDDPLTVHLYRCPMMTLARRDTELVCSVHEDLARSVLAQQPGPVSVDRLEPFVEPHHCVLRLTVERSHDGSNSAE
ncbi:MAG: transcriptional regulator [Actinobacteria bacterium HGW-Actinobacteria-4]|nr:MAG: transcriptional regulator [Actinobacteria bacterium HGW-Actinobacteria-4]